MALDILPIALDLGHAIYTDGDDLWFSDPESDVENCDNSEYFDRQEHIFNEILSELGRK